jgi:hypothetical protein
MINQLRFLTNYDNFHVNIHNKMDLILIYPIFEIYNLDNVAAIVYCRKRMVYSRIGTAFRSQIPLLFLDWVGPRIFT